MKYALVLALALASGPVLAQSLTARTPTEEAIDEGRIFTAQVVTPTLAAAATYLVGLQTGARPIKVLDRFYDVAFDNCTIELFENSYTGGTPLLSVANRNFVIGGSAPMTFTSAPTATPTNLVASIFLRNAAGATGTIGVQGETLQYVLKPNTQYVLRVTNSGTGSGVARLTYNFRNMLTTE